MKNASRNFLPHNHFIVWQIFIGLCLLTMLFLLFGSANLDEVEHLRSAYYVSLDHLPYRDFFEHHHPLLWYLWAPLMQILPENSYLSLYIARTASLLVSLLTGVYIYKIEKKFIGGKVAALLCLSLYLASFRTLSVLLYVKPDTYMRLFYFIGLYELFCYFRYQKPHHLNLAAAAFAVGFCFLQTIIPQLIVLAFFAGYFLYHHRRCVPDFCMAGAIFATILACFFGFFALQNAWSAYFELNWLFNAKLTAYLSASSTQKVLYFLLFIDLIGFAVAALICRCKQNHNPYFYMLGALFVTEFVQRFAGWSVYVHYLSFMLIYASMLAAPLLLRLIKKYRPLGILLLLWLSLRLCLNFCGYIFQPHRLKFYESPPQQTFGLLGGIYRPHNAYYWMYPNIECIHHVFFNPTLNYNINQQITAEKPDILVNPDYSTKTGEFEMISRTYRLTPEQQKILQNHIFDTKILQNYDEIAPNVYRLKSTRP